MTRGTGWRVLAPPSIAIPRVGFVLYIVTTRSGIFPYLLLPSSFVLCSWKKDRTLCYGLILRYKYAL